jgi:outer membrane receptor protein involved in Fe transport
MRFAKFFICALGILAVALPAVAQIPTGTLIGHVDDGKVPLPGVTVTVTSPSLQGARIATTSVNGDYIFTFLPPGDYNVRFELQGFQTVETGIKLSAAQRSTVNATMPQAKVAEEVTVTGSYETISTSAQAASTITQDLLNKLPIAQTFYNYASLAAGTASTGPSGNLTISGAASFENLFMVNGVSIQDNIRNTPTNLFIEDAIQETTTQTAAVSAEYGRFAGGVVNMLTKSGGNEMHGSVRLNLDSSKWSNKAPLQTGILNDTINRTWMATLGGFIFKDKLWYFLGYRNRSTSNSTQTYVTNIPYTLPIDEKRYEGKLTYSITPNHRIIGSYIKNDQTQGNNSFNRVMDLTSLYTRQLPTDLTSANYTGILTDNFFVEGQYSRKTFAFENSGSSYTDIIKGTLMIDRALGGTTYRYWSPTFCGVCGPEKRDNKEYIAKATYFLSTAGIGTHDLVAGYDAFDDERFSNNYQSGSNYRILGTDVIVRNGVIFPQLLTSNTILRWTPIFALTKGTNFWTNSAFANDKWRLNDHLSFNVGVRYDKNDGKDADGKLVAKDANWSPRLGITWDPKANGEWAVNASYGKYVMAIANSIADSSAVGGQPGTIDFLYKGPEINADKNAANLIDTATAIQMVFDWFNSVGGADLTKNPYVDAVDIPGATALIKGSLNSTNAVEYTVGVTKRLGSRGMLRVDYVNRKYGDFYALQRDLTTGTVTTPNGTFDKGYYINDSNALERKYYGLQVQFSYRPIDALSIGGNYTYSNAYGNWDAENVGSGPITSGIFNYPQYLRASWYAPKGDLSIDQKHKARVWAVFDVLNTKHNSLSVSVMESYLSGQPYGANGTINLVSGGVPYVPNPGYKTPPSTQSYWFTNRDAFHEDNETRLDLSVNYGFKVPALGTQLEFFVIPAITNVLNEKAVTNPNASVYTSRNSGQGLSNFNPFATEPIECPQANTAAQCTAMGANWKKSPTFGKPVSYTDYQTPRTFTLSVGVRF